jgi:transposase
MEHVAIDLGGKHSQICIRDAGGQILEEGKVSTGTLRLFLSGRPQSRVIVETCAEAFRVADDALELGHEVRVVPATLVRTLGVGARKTKTDKRDARALSEVSTRIDLPSVHIPSATSRHRKTLAGMREALVEARTSLVNTVRGWLRAEAERPTSGVVKTFPARVRTWAEQRKVPLPACVERQLLTIEQLTAQIKLADAEMSEEAEADPVCQRLMTMPGVGPVTSVRFVAALDVESRFEGAHKVEAFLGLTPGESSSSERQNRRGITKAGPPAVRRTLVQAAWCVLRTHPSLPMAAWARNIEKRSGPRVAVTALARKMAGILYAMWRDGTTFDGSRSASPQAEE